MNITHFAIVGVGISFTGLGLILRKQKKNWLAFFIGGITMLVLVALSLIFGFSI